MPPARAAALALALLLSGCAQGDGGGGDGPEQGGPGPEAGSGWVRKPCPDAGPGPAPEVPGILLSSANRTTLLRPDGNGSFAEAASASVSMRSAVALDGFLFGVEDEAGEGDAAAVVKRDMALREIARVPFADVGDLAAAEGLLWMVNRWNLTALDASLEEVGRVSLEMTHLAKQPDGVEVHDGTAYVLDDVVLPFVVFRVDVRDPARMEVLERHESGSSGAPTFQWLGADGTWYVEGGFSGRGGAHQSVESLPLDGAPGQVSLFTLSYDPDGEGETVREGFFVRDSTFLLPAWAWLSGHRVQLLGKVGVEDGLPTLACELETGMEMALPPDPFVRREGDVVVVAHGLAVEAYDARSRPALLASLDLEQPVSGLALVPG